MKKIFIRLKGNLSFPVFCQNKNIQMFFETENCISSYRQNWYSHLFITIAFLAISHDIYLICCGWRLLKHFFFSEKYEKICIFFFSTLTKYKEHDIGNIIISFWKLNVWKLYKLNILQTNIKKCNVCLNSLFPWVFDFFYHCLILKA